MLREWSSGHPRCSCSGGSASATCSLEAARDGHGGVPAVYGGPGVGKTALREACGPWLIADRDQLVGIASRRPRSRAAILS
jgi:hypothetical protein